MKNNDTIYASSLKGFCTVDVCWQILYDVSSQLSELHSQNTTYGYVDLNHIMVQTENFVLVDVEEAIKCEWEQDVWNLAAAALELMLGSPVFNGEGESAQNEKTPIPFLPQPDAVALNSLIQNCMSLHKTDRPTAAEIHAVAGKNLEILRKQKRTPRIHTSAKSYEHHAAIDCQWPERMLSSLVKCFIVLFFIVLHTSAYAQVQLDPQEETVTQKLLDAVLILRHGDQKSWDMAQYELEKRLSQFTLMNKLIDRTNDCPLVNSQMKTFGVNRIVTALKSGQHVQFTGKELLDATDAKFKYSLIEKVVKEGRTSTYTLSGRSGKQVLLIVPYSAKQEYVSELIREDGTKYIPAGKDSNGVTYYIIETSKGPEKGEDMTLKISNKEKKGNASFVIINHNYQNKQ